MTETNWKFDPAKYEGHTKGEWKDVGVLGHLEIVVYTVNDRVMPVARCYVEGQSGPITFVTPKEAEANARLIADAPLLLAEVRRLKNLVSDFYEYQKHVLENNEEEDLDTYHAGECINHPWNKRNRGKECVYCRVRRVLGEEGSTQ